MSHKMRTRDLLAVLIRQPDASYPIRVSQLGRLGGPRVIGWARPEDAARYCSDRTVKLGGEPVVAGDYVFERP